MKDTSDRMSLMGAVVYAILILGIVLLLIFGIEGFAQVILPMLVESVNLF